MARYLALIEFDAAADAYGLVIPDFPGCNAMGTTFEEAEANGVEALREWAADILAEADALPRARDIAELRRDPSLSDDFTPNVVVTSLPVFIDEGRTVRANVSMDAALLAEIDEAARLRGLTRSAFLVSAARHKIAAERGLLKTAE